MEKIKRPKEVSRNENRYLNLEQLQDSLKIQLNDIYNKFDEIIDLLNKKGE